MPRPLRFVPAGSLVEVTTRTIQGRLLLKPSPELTEIILGVYGAADQSRVDCVACDLALVHELGLNPQLMIRLELVETFDRPSLHISIYDGVMISAQEYEIWVSISVRERKRA